MRKLKNVFLAKIAWHYFVRKGEKSVFSCTLSVLAKTFFGSKTVKTRKHYTNRGFSGNCPRPKMTLFWKRCFWHGWKVSFTNCVFEKLCSSENTIFIVCSAKHSGCSKTLYVEKTEFMKNSGLFLNMAKGCFCWFFRSKCFGVCFCVFGEVAKVLKMLVFPSFGAFVGWHILVYLGLEGLGVFVFLCFCFSFA